MKTIIINILTAVVIAATTSATARGIEVTVNTPGGLEAALGGTTAVTELTVAGTIDASDFETIAALQNLGVLDLSRASIAAYDGARLSTGLTHSAAGVLPPFSLAGSGIATLRLPASLTAIGEGALAASMVESIALPPTLTEVGEGAFNSCTRLTAVELPASCTAVGRVAFAGCTSLTAVSAPGLTAIKAGTFRGCHSLGALHTGSLVSIGDDALAGCRALEELKGAAGVGHVGAGALSGSGLRSVDLSGATTVATGALMGCRQLESVSVDPRELADGALACTPALFSIETGGSVEHIGALALANATALREWTLPAGVRSLGDGAMEGCTALTVIHAEDATAIPALGDDVWAGVDQSAVLLSVNPAMATQWSEADQWNRFNIAAAGIDDAVAAPAAGITIMMAGRMLTIAAPADIAEALVYDINGRMITSAGPAGRVEIDCSDLPAGILLVKATDTDGNTASSKVVNR